MNNDIAEGKWKQMVGKAKAAWGELTDDELTKAEGHADRLAGLIQERYGKTR
ncbi:MAG TPA: CsbD family protein, partial [Paraburkholderia sp.]|nr:CsbD family protein [Paraburkholderia sp.]